MRVEIFIVNGNNEHFLLCHNVSKVVCCWCVNPFPHTTNLQQTTLKVSLEKLYKCRYDNRKKLKTLCQKQKLLVLSNFFFWHNVFPKPSAAEALQSIYMRKGLILFLFLTGYYCVENATVNAPTGNICPAGSYCPTGSPSNIFCPNLSYTNHTGASICYTCRAGFSCTKKIENTLALWDITAPRAQVLMSSLALLVTLDPHRVCHRYRNVPIVLVGNIANWGASLLKPGIVLQNIIDRQVGFSSLSFWESD